jgi:glutamate dehydrogenase (NAD(P)+)
MNIPYGGAKGGVIVDPSRLSPSELERLTRRYATDISILMNPSNDVPAPDVGTNPQIMAWIMDTYSMHFGAFQAAVVTGKPLEVGGSLGRNEATGRGVMITAREAMNHLDIPINGARVAVQGFGNVGSIAARTAHEMGCKVIAATDVMGGVLDLGGLHVPSLIEHVRKTGSVVNFPGTEPIDNPGILALDCEVLIPAALENQITKDNAAQVKARIVAEGANGPTTDDADPILDRNGIFVIPDILCNGGGVTVSYFEWVQDQQLFFWTEDEITRRLEHTMVTAFHDVLRFSQEHKINLRTAAQALAIRRVARATMIRGIYP